MPDSLHHSYTEGFVMFFGRFFFKVYISLIKVNLVVPDKLPILSQKLYYIKSLLFLNSKF